MAPAGIPRCGDGERSDQLRTGTAEAGEGDWNFCCEKLRSGLASWPNDVVCILRVCSWFRGLPRLADDAALTAVEAGVTVIAIDVSTDGIECLGKVEVVGVV